MAESGQTPTSKRLGPVDHTCQRKSCCEPNLRAMSQVETQTLLIGLSLWLAAKSKRAAADKDSLHVLNVGNDAWGAPASKGRLDLAPPDMTPFEVPVSASASDVSVSGRGVARETSSHLRPEDAFLNYSPPYRSTTKNGASEDRRKRDSRGNRNASRRRPRTWKKLLWVKQACMRRITAREAILKSPKTETFRSRQLYR